ncbi:MAG: hypothetical protein HQ559_09680, partial [Lentisphaerae bacterium]|nr:hypothetical protein [Lentisphaerota bacterium]
ALSEHNEAIRYVSGGAVVEQDNPEAFAQAMLELAHNRDKRRAMGSCNRCEVQEKYQWESSARKLKDFFESTAKERKERKERVENIRFHA